MTNKDIFNYITFRAELEQMLNNYVQMGLPATILKPVVEEALTAIVNASKDEIENAKAEIEAEKLIDEHKEAEDNALYDFDGESSKESE